MRSKHASQLGYASALVCLVLITACRTTPSPDRLPRSASPQGHENAAHDKNGHLHLAITAQENGAVSVATGSYPSVQNEQIDQEEDDTFFHPVAPTLLLPQKSGTITPAGVKVEPDVAVKVLENISRGELPFKPELGRAGCSWFVSEGNPYTGASESKIVDMPAKIEKPAKLIRFSSEDLVKIRDEQLSKLTQAEIESVYRKQHDIPADKPLSNRVLRRLKPDGWFAKHVVAEAKMWDEVGRRVRQSAVKVGEVILKNSEFSKSGDGKFLVVADAAKIQIEGGVNAVVTALEKSGIKAEPVLVQAAEQMALRYKWVGKVKTAFRHGGRVIIVFAVAADVYMIYKAEDRVKAVVSTAAGWAGATATSAYFATTFAPLNAGGPLGSAAYGVGILVSGGVGYWIASKTTATIYELVLE